ncbi:MAG: hypothetical protein PVJ72_12765 [Gammaproteobacteria bacterium]
MKEFITIGKIGFSGVGLAAHSSIFKLNSDACAHRNPTRTPTLLVGRKRRVKARLNLTARVHRLSSQPSDFRA